MGALSPARAVALAALSEHRRRGAHVRELFRTRDDVAELSDRDRALAMRLVTGAVGCEGMVLGQLRRYVTHPGKLEPRVRDALQLAGYEALFLDTPGAITVSQGVELVRSVSPRAAGMANAVLRRLTDEARPELDVVRERVASGSTDPGELALVSGLPTWLVERISADRGPAYARDLARSQAEPAPVYVFPNVARHTPDELPVLLDEAGVDWEPTELPGALLVPNPSQLMATTLMDDVDLVVCDLGAQLACRVADPEPGLSLLEVGQGRATKTILLSSLARLAEGTSYVVGVDSVSYKVGVASLRLTRGGWQDSTACVVADATQLDSDDLPPELDRSFHQVFVDVPCSGTGTMRRHPETAWSLEPESLDAARPDSLPTLQLSMLEAAASRVEPGGILTYSTCSVLKAEDERVVERFLASELGQSFAVDMATGTLSDGACSAVAAWLTPTGFLLTGPAPDGCDGHFCARMVRSL